MITISQTFPCTTVVMTFIKLLLISSSARHSTTSAFTTPIIPASFLMVSDFSLTSQTTTRTMKKIIRKRELSITRKITSTSSIKMFNIHHDDVKRNNNKLEEKSSKNEIPTSNGEMILDGKKVFQKKLPPKPEDMFVMTGDLLSLSIYGFFDHFISQDIMAASVKHADTTAKLSALLSTASPASQTAVNTDYLLSTPVWVDCSTSPNLSHILQITVSDQLVTKYSPILSQTGSAVTALAACWLLSGYIHEAFAYRNTLNCRTDTALLVTAKTWVTCSIMLFAITALSHIVCGCEIIAFTKGDIEYIVDTLSVLTLWRFLASYMLGTGRD